MNMNTVLSEKEYGFAFPAKITHLEPHPSAHMIKFRATFRFELPLQAGLHFNHFDIMDIHYFKYVVRDIKGRTDNNIFNSGGKLLKTELEILKMNMDESYKEYFLYMQNSQYKKAEFINKRNSEYAEYDYQRIIDYIDENIENLRSEWQDYQIKYERESAIKNGTYQQYLDNLEDYW